MPYPEAQLIGAELFVENGDFIIVLGKQQLRIANHGIQNVDITIDRPRMEFMTNSTAFVQSFQVTRQETTTITLKLTANIVKVENCSMTKKDVTVKPGKTVLRGIDF